MHTCTYKRCEKIMKLVVVHLKLQYLLDKKKKNTNTLETNVNTNGMYITLFIKILHVRL